MIKIISKYKFWVFIFTIFLILRLPSLFEPYWYGDEGIYLTLGQGIRKGLILYHQIHDNKPPLLYYLAALVHTVFGFRLLLLLVMVPTIIIFYKLAQKFLSNFHSKIAVFLFLILTSIPLLEGNIANAEIFMLLPTLAGTFLVLISNKPFKFLIAGFLLGLSLAIKIPVLFEFIFLFIWLIFSQSDFSFSKFKKNFWLIINNLFHFSFGFIFPILVFSLYFVFLGAFKDFIFAAILQNFGYVSSWSTGNFSGSISQGGLFFRALLLIIIFLIIFFLKIKKIIDSKLAFLLLWFYTTIFCALLSGRPYPHYLIQILPSFCLLIGLLISKINWFSRIFLLLSFFLSFLFISQYKFYFYPVISYYQNFYVQFWKNRDSYRNFFGNDVSNNFYISKFIKQNTSSNDRIFVWGDEPYIYPLSDRLPATRLIVAYHIIDFNGFGETINQLKAYLPKFIIYYQMNNRPFPDLDNFINRYYFVSQIFGSTTIFQLR